ncbi:LysR family transcriptional regulator [Francisella sp. SYW-9]|uniref:LysR family transcriptional regulator n=1 Tax=Francisella sp. SYW-9 TaxID=2610888 RepID=UPI00123E21AD|nr:LysR family transcriptional regulator [Francisella sp. SYW-9]
MDFIHRDIIEATRYFLKLVELGSYRGVKRYFLVEVNTIKYKIESLEEFLGIRLIKNVQNRITPTEEGGKFYNSCNRTVKDLENILQTVKKRGFKERKSLNILGVPLFMKIFMNRILPEIQKANKKSINFTLNTYQADNLNGHQYQFDSYSVIQIFTKHLEYIDLDDWIVCASIDAIKIPAYLYGNDTTIKSIHDDPQKIIDAPFVFSSHNLTQRITEFKYKSKTYKFNLDNIKYIVDDEIQKANLIINENVIGFMPISYHDTILKDFKNITKIEHVEIEFPIYPYFILVYKHSDFRDELIRIIRSEIQKIQALYLHLATK